jgi:acyl carrier protein
MRLLTFASLLPATLPGDTLQQDGGTRMRSSAMPEHGVMAAVTQIFRAVLNQPDLELTPRSTADEVPGWDSMTHIAVVVEAECRFGIEFRTTEVESLQSVGELVRAIEAKRALAA